MSENTTPNLQPEVSLPIAPTIGEIDHFRIINKNGQSQKATITQVRELMGIDYSKLEEQIVHGEYWMGADGVKRQVYTKRIIAKVPSSAYGAGGTGLFLIDPTPVADVIVISGSLIPSNTPNSASGYREGFIGSTISLAHYWTLLPSGEGVKMWIDKTTWGLGEGTIKITVKYTKL